MGELRFGVYLALEWLGRGSELVTEGEADLPGIVTSNLIDHLQSRSQRGWIAKRDLCIVFVLDMLSSLAFHFSVPASYVLSHHPVSTEQSPYRERT